ncbi:unnamed protein product [Bursaphelenchus okinawaensis]|uniref:Peptidase A1 domain-containing protein n=1 Tax=Bursaphelenchus okinawaensis TaxID=465554 RepID=A0A811KRH3_9BILA|nr:unnamed protein product [Bursaphelenchus okinawaensis]CAG9109726.1 unnamed protein product [Bursaphelenchus okinawaensis]
MLLLILVPLSLITTPSRIFDKIVDAFDAKYNDEYELYLVDCDSDVSLTIVLNNNDHVIEAKHLLLKIENTDQCILSVEPLDLFGIDFILGDPFIRQFCQVHDVEQQRVGLAKSKA